MRKRWYLGVMIALLVVAGAILYFYRLSLDAVAFYAIEALIFVCLTLVAIFYYSVFRSMRTIIGGMDLLLEQDFTTRLAHVGQADADKIVDMFNFMINSLKEERLRVREQSHLMDLLVDKSPMGVIMLNGMDVISSANPAALQYLAATDAVGLRTSQINSPLAAVLAGLKNGECVTATLSDSMIYRCSRLTFMDKGYQHPFYIIEPMTREVREAQKESYGRVIRMLSHEVNNSMTAVGSLLSTIAYSNTDDATVELIDVCMQRCRSLSSFITSYANVVKIPQPVFSRVKVGEFVSSSAVLFESICVEHGCALHIVISDDFNVDIDTVLMEQAIINIVKNAAESIDSTAHKNAGKVSIVLDSKRRTLTVADNGPGISSDVAANLFKPFFSTKANGQGIGLIFIAEALTRNDCTFTLQTDADGLTRFTIAFPASSRH